MALHKNIKKEPKDKHKRAKSSGKQLGLPSPQQHQEEHQREQQGLSQDQGDAGHDVQRDPQKHTKGVKAKTHRGKHVETQGPLFSTEDDERSEDIIQFNRQEVEQHRPQSHLMRSRERQVTSLLPNVLPFMSFLVVSREAFRHFYLNINTSNIYSFHISR